MKRNNKIFSKGFLILIMILSPMVKADSFLSINSRSPIPAETDKERVNILVQRANLLYAGQFSDELGEFTTTFPFLEKEKVHKSQNFELSYLKGLLVLKNGGVFKFNSESFEADLKQLEQPNGEQLFKMLIIYSNVEFNFKIFITNKMDLIVEIYDEGAIRNIGDELTALIYEANTIKRSNEIREAIASYLKLAGFVNFRFLKPEFSNNINLGILKTRIDIKLFDVDIKPKLVAFIKALPSEFSDEFKQSKFYTTTLEDEKNTFLKGLEFVQKYMNPNGESQCRALLSKRML